ncbi:hypothetical protein SEA_WEASELS2_200 [Rhodococcus phage Weasels2]|uniref:Uncharacterized protein n=1 Tax=Rhodococcus phage Weasels2 TaxID=1897437 RepID=A0A1I9SAH2_9CAUD|nr:hypothetical protein FDH04_gp216 [Rhodococcus phage Weasels2]AOZ63778.1 hypothetical protein SEA_WEASELS2_200 [Rhodococcus phage Weasels2]
MKAILGTGLAVAAFVGYIWLMTWAGNNKQAEENQKIEDNRQEARIEAICEERGGLWINDECLQKDSIVKIEVK